VVAQTPLPDGVVAAASCPRDGSKPPQNLSVDCVGAIQLNGHFYALGCTAVRATAVSDRVVGRGSYFQETVEVRAMHNVDPSLILAISRAGGCMGGEPKRSSWSFAFLEGERGANMRYVAEVVCRVGIHTPAEKADSRCTSRGG
jgi:hypothetical protein